MKATFEFNLDNKEECEHEKFKVFSNADNLYWVLYNFDQYLRAQIKYHDKEELEDVREKLWEFMEEDNVSLNWYS